MLSGKRIILGVTGGIAAYKAVYLLREFQKAGAEVRVTLTPAATRFVGTETFAALSRNEVPVSIFPGDKSRAGENWVRHIQWAEWADLFVVAPCTANTLAKLVNGFSDSMLTATALSVRCPLLLCPTMDGGMYHHPATRVNLEKAVHLGFHILDPEEGYLASGLEDTGRLPEPDAILKKAQQILSDETGAGSGQSLAGKHVVVTAGPTREFFDPVRFISNPSSGKMGFAMARAARDLGAEVTLLHGPVNLPPVTGIKSMEFASADDLFAKIKKLRDADVIIMAAAVSDYKPSEVRKQKVKKNRESSTFTLDPTPDILQWLGEHRSGEQVLIGFAMETENLRENALGKLKKKKADWIVANLLSEEGSGFSGDTNTVLLLNGSDEKTISGSKDAVAMKLLKTIFPVKTTAGSRR